MAGEEGYSFSLTTFSPSGKLLQLEHALKAVQAGKTSLGIQGTQAAAALPRDSAAGCRGAGVASARLRARRASPRRAAVNGVVIATEKKVPSILVDETSVERIAKLTDHIGEGGASKCERGRTRDAHLRFAY